MQKQTREVRYLGAINLFYFAPFEYTKTKKQTMCKKKELTLRSKQVSLLQIFLIGVFLGPKTVQLKQTNTQWNQCSNKQTNKSKKTKQILSLCIFLIGLFLCLKAMQFKHPNKGLFQRMAVKLKDVKKFKLDAKYW